MIPILGGLFLTKRLQQLEENYQSLKFWLQLPMPGTWDSWESPLLVFLQWQIPPSCCMTTMRSGQFTILLSFSVISKSSTDLCLVFAVPERYCVLAGNWGIWIHNQFLQFVCGIISSELVIRLSMMRYMLSSSWWQNSNYSIIRDALPSLSYFRQIFSIFVAGIGSAWFTCL